MKGNYTCLPPAIGISSTADASFAFCIAKAFIIFILERPPVPTSSLGDITNEVIKESVANQF